ncbi:MAG: type II secretion system F family protein [Candidatus Berkelbacteria bacterium]
MTKFLYKAKNEQGEIVTGSVSAENQSLAESVLIRHNLVPVNMMLEHKILKVDNWFKPTVSVKEKAVFSRQLATMLSSGISLTKAISMLAAQAAKPYLKSIFLEVYKDLEEGFNLSGALAKHPDVFDRLYISIVASGESTGKLDVVLDQLSKKLEADHNFMSKVRGALYYPAFILIVMLLIGTYMMASVVPKLATVFEQSGKALPISTQILLAMSGFMASYWWVVILGLLVIFLLVRFWLSSESGARWWNRFELEMPGLRQMTENVAMTRFSRVMAMLIEAGVPLLDALKIGATIMNNVIYEEAIVLASQQVEKGVPLSVQMSKDPVFPVLLSQMMSVGEETGELGKILDKVAIYYEENSEENIKIISTLVEPVVLVIIGAAVAFLVFSILLPIYSIAGSAGA